MSFTFKKVIDQSDRLSLDDFCNEQGDRLQCAKVPSWLGGDLIPLLKEGPSHYLLDSTFKMNAPLRRLKIGFRDLILLRDPEIIKTVILDKEHLFARDSSSVQELFEGGLLSLSGDAWFQRRQLLASCFHLSVASDVIPHVEQSIQSLIVDWRSRQGASIRPSPDLAWCMLNILGLFAFGVSLDRDQHGGKPLHRALITLTKDAVARAFSPIPYWKLFRSSKVAESRRYLRELAKKIVELAEHERASLRQSSLLSVMLDARDRGALDQEGLIGEVVTFLVAGHETSATSLAWILHLFTQNPHLVMKCREEANQVLPNDITQTDYHCLERMTYTTAVVKEAMRLYPPVPLSMHISLERTVLAGFAIPKGTNILVSSMIAHRDSNSWRSPLEFDPNRFLEKGQIKHRCQYIPFLLGPHTCIGQHLAQIELVIAAARLAQHFDFPDDGHSRVDSEIRVSLYPKGLVVKPVPIKV